MQTRKNLFKATKANFFQDENSTSSAQQSHIRYEIYKLVRLYRKAVSGGTGKDLVDFVQILVDNSERIQQAVAAWIELIDLLVHDAEARFGTASGKGKIKSAEVKAALRYLLRGKQFLLPNIPSYLQPVIVDLFVSWLIDSVVYAANKYDLWDTSNSTPQTFASRVRMGIYRVVMLFRPIWEAAARLGVYIWELFQERIILSPAVKAAVQRVQREGTIQNQQAALVDVTKLFIWIGEHHEQVLAAFDLVFEAVREAEKFAQMSNQQKKAYAKSLVLVVLDEVGFPMDSLLFSAIAHSLVDVAIEGAVRIFNRRDPAFRN